MKSLSNVGRKTKQMEADFPNLGESSFCSGLYAPLTFWKEPWGNQCASQVCMLNLAGSNLITGGEHACFRSQVRSYYMFRANFAQLDQLIDCRVGYLLYFRCVNHYCWRTLTHGYVVIAYSTLLLELGWRAVNCRVPGRKGFIFHHGKYTKLSSLSTWEFHIYTHKQKQKQRQKTHLMALTSIFSQAKAG